MNEDYIGPAKCNNCVCIYSNRYGGKYILMCQDKLRYSGLCCCNPLKLSLKDRIKKWFRR